MEFFNYLDEYRVGKRNDWIRSDGVEPSGPSQYFHELVWKVQVEATKYRMAGNAAAAHYHETVCEQLLAESHWVENDRPYVKVYPKMASLLSRIRLNVPMSLLKLPYMAFSIRFGSDHANQLREAPDKPPIQSLFVFQSFEYKIDPSSMLNLGAMCRSGIDSNRIAKEMPLILPRPTNPMQFVSLYYQYGEVGSQMGDGMGDGFVRLYYDPDITIAEAMKHVHNKKPVAMSEEVFAKEYQPSWYFTEQLMSITLASCLMIDGDDDNILPDLPRKLIPKYDQASKLSDKERDKAYQQVMSKAKKSGHTGLSLGQKHEIELPRPVYARDHSVEPGGEDSGGYELQWGHFRSPHPRLQSFGPRDRQKHKIVWIKLARVREDLPLDPRPRNVRITDRALE